MAGIFDTIYANSPLSPQVSSGLGMLFSAPVPLLQEAPKWIHVTRRFQRLMENIGVTDPQYINGLTKQAGIRDCLNRHYYGYSSETANSLLIGSWGKATRVRPPRDIDILFLLPEEVFHRYQLRAGNKQSALLQEVKGVLEATYSQTTMRGDGQVVVVPFNTIPVEVSPGFLCNNGSIIVCNANSGGSYVTSTARAEAAALDASDLAYYGNARRLARMMKQWQRHCNVPLKSFQLERLACEFLAGYAFAKEDLFYSDWLVRDFLAYLIGRVNTPLFMPGTNEVNWLGDLWLSRAQTAQRNATAACDYERDNANLLAGLFWQDIFGNMIPIEV